MLAKMLSSENSQADWKTVKHWKAGVLQSDEEHLPRDPAALPQPIIREDYLPVHADRYVHVSIDRSIV